MTEEEIIAEIERAQQQIQAHNYLQAEEITEKLLPEKGLQDHPILNVRVLNLQVDSLLRQWKMEKAISFSEIALAAAERLDPNVKELHTAKALYNLGNIFQYQANYSKSLEYLTQAIGIYEKLDEKLGIANSHNALGNTYLYLADYSAALESFSRSLEMFEQIGDKFSVAICLNCIGTINMDLSNFTLALENSSKAFEIFEQIGSKRGQAGILNNIGTIYTDTANYPLALEHFTKALQLNEELDNQEWIAANLSNIGSVYEYLTDYSRALVYYKKALDIQEQIGNKRGIATCLQGISLNYKHLADYLPAVEYNSKAIEINEQIGDKKAISQNLGNLGDLYFKLGQYLKALDHLLRALALSEELDISYQKSHWLYHLGSIYAESKFENYNPEIAEEYLLAALAESKKIELKNVSRDAHAALADLYQSQARWKDAYETKLKQEEIEKEINAEEAKTQARNMEYKRQMEESERDRQVKLARFQEQEKILHKILPAQIAERIAKGEGKIIQRYESATVLFADMVGFTVWSQTKTVDEVADTLNTLFNLFDELANEFGVEKIKTIGDAYMCVAGVPEACEDHAERMAKMALAMLSKVESNFPNGEIKLRIGIHSGEVIAGVLGKNKYAYDLWGDTVNTASRMESHGAADKIQVSEEFRNQLGDIIFKFEDRGEMEVKGKGKMKTYFLNKAV